MCGQHAVPGRICAYQFVSAQLCELDSIILTITILQKIRLTERLNNLFKVTQLVSSKAEV